MRRFIRTWSAKRSAIVFVIQDGRARQFEIYVWRAAHPTPTRQHVYPYATDPGAQAFVRGAVLTEARRIAAQERTSTPITDEPKGTHVEV